MKHLSPIINPETLPAELRERARLRRLLAHSNGDLTDADYLLAAADEIERLRKAPVQLPIPVIAEIEPTPDTEYGHFFKWPEEVTQFIELSPMESEGERHA